MIDFLRLSAEALILTIAIEVSIAWLFGLRSKKELWAVTLINVITNPLLNYLIMVNSNFHLISQVTVLILCLEAGVVVAEWRLLVYALRLGVIRMLVLSVVMNSLSYLAGFFVFNQWYQLI